MAANRVGKSAGNRPILALFSVDRIQRTPARGQKPVELDSERAAAPDPTASARPTMINGRVLSTKRWVGGWSGDHLLRVKSPGKDGCADQKGTLCPKLVEARAKQALAELQLTEFNHRLANVLQRLVNRIDRQLRAQDDWARREELERLMASVHASARLHQYLVPPRTQKRVNLGSLLENVVAAIEGVTGLICDIEVEPINVSSQVAVHLAAAVNELTWNAHKHAYRGTEGGKIRIVCLRSADGRLQLSVADQGCGLPAGFDPQAGEGLGFTIIRAIARQFDGELRVEFAGGARFTLLLNIPSI